MLFRSNSRLPGPSIATAEKTPRSRGHGGREVRSDKFFIGLNSFVKSSRSQVHFPTDYEPHVQAALPGLVVPQRVHVPPPGPHMFQRLPSLQFFVKNVAGVRLADALNPPINGLHNAVSIPMLSTTTNRVALRILVSRSRLAILIHP